MNTSTPAGTEPRYALSIVVPVYRGAASVGELVDALAALKIEGGHEVILVNDGSPDDSGAVCRRLAARTDLPVTFVDLSRNYGEHNAVMAGLRHVRGRFVITMDDDLQNPTSEVVKLFEHARDGTLHGAISAAASPTASPTGCSTSRAASICRAFAA
jgi:glycosyltransferase involved in cell wall biosynthesis